MTDNVKNVCGCKQMKSKDRLTLMVCVLGSGHKVLLAYVGKSKKPTCFSLDGEGAPTAYIHQKMHGSLEK